MAQKIGDLAHALDNGDEPVRRLAGRRPAVFFDYDGTLTPIVVRPADTLTALPVRVRTTRAVCDVEEDSWWSA